MDSAYEKLNDRKFLQAISIWASVTVASVNRRLFNKGVNFTVVASQCRLPFEGYLGESIHCIPK